jgi:hypothetical protein
VHIHCVRTRGCVLSESYTSLMAVPRLLLNATQTPACERGPCGQFRQREFFEPYTKMQARSARIRMPKWYMLSAPLTLTRAPPHTRAHSQSETAAHTHVPMGAFVHIRRPAACVRLCVDDGAHKHHVQILDSLSARGGGGAKSRAAAAAATTAGRRTTISWCHPCAHEHLSPLFSPPHNLRDC